MLAARGHWALLERSPGINGVPVLSSLNLEKK